MRDDKRGNPQWKVKALTSVGMSLTLFTMILGVINALTLPLSGYESNQWKFEGITNSIIDIDTILLSTTQLYHVTSPAQCAVECLLLFVDCSAFQWKTDETCLVSAGTNATIERYLLPQAQWTSFILPKPAKSKFLLSLLYTLYEHNPHLFDAQATKPLD